MAESLPRLGVSMAVRSGDSVRRLLSGGNIAGSCVVLNYHSILKQTREQFGRQLDLLMTLAKPVFATRETNFKKGERCVAVTVDDLFCSFVENGLPELVARKIPVTVFVPTGYLGKKSAWDDYGGENKVGEVVASAEELKRMSAMENVDFGSHCVSHPDLARLSEVDARRELRDSKETLEKIIGRKVVALSFPYGSYGERELRLAREEGYEFCFDSTPQSIFSHLKPGLIGRVSAQPTESNVEFRLKTLGAFRWVRSASNWKRKVVKPAAATTQTEPVQA